MASIGNTYSLAPCRPGCAFNKQPVRDSLDKRALVAGTFGLAALALVMAMPQLLGDEVGDALAGLAEASPRWLWTAALAFLALIVSTACAWRAGLRACGGNPIGVGDASARYACGSLVNALAPGGCGGPVRIALYSRTLDCRERLWTAAGVATAIGIARAPALALLVLAAAATTGFPLWPVLLLLAAVAAAGVVAFFARGWTPRGRVGHVLDVFRALGRSPGIAGSLVGWVSLATAARVAAAAAIATALGIQSPLAAAVVMVPALAFSGLVPLTPGNFGIGSGAIAVALHILGVDGSTAIATGLAFQTVETSVSIVAGSAALLSFTRLPSWSLRLAGAGACLALVGGVSVTLLV